MPKAYGYTIRAYRPTTGTWIKVHRVVKALTVKVPVQMASDQYKIMVTSLPDFEISLPTVPIVLNTEIEIKLFEEGGILNVGT